MIPDRWKVTSLPEWMYHSLMLFVKTAVILDHPSKWNTIMVYNNSESIICATLTNVTMAFKVKYTIVQNQ